MLDRLIELRVFGRKPVSDVPPYSTSDSAADMVVRVLARPPWRWMCLQSGRDSDGARRIGHAGEDSGRSPGSAEKRS